MLACPARSPHDLGLADGPEQNGIGAGIDPLVTGLGFREPDTGHLRHGENGPGNGSVVHDPVGAHGIFRRQHAFGRGHMGQHHPFRP